MGLRLPRVDGRSGFRWDRRVRKVLPAAFFLAVVAGALYLGLHHGPNTGKHELKIPGLSSSAPKADAKDSLVLRGNFARALRRMRAAGAVRVESMRVSPGLVSADVPSGAHYVTLQVKPGGDARKTDTSLRRADRSKTRPLEAVNAGAPERLAREGAQRLHVGIATVDYLTYDAEGLFGTHWTAHFKNGATADGNTAGQLLKTHP
jgi:hypothetical protein